MPLGMLLLLFCQRQRKDKLRTNAFRADTVDIFSMCLDDFFYNGKSKSGTLLVFSAGEVCLVETIPDLFDAVFWNADSGVFDGNKDFLIFFGRLDRDCGVCVAEFERIVDQVIKTCWILLKSAETNRVSPLKIRLKLICFSMQVPSKVCTVMRIV